MKVTKIDNSNFEKIVNNKKYDVVVFVIDTDFDDVSLNISKYIDTISEKFKSFGIKFVLFTYFDLNENGLLNLQDNNYNKGDILIFPSSSKNVQKFTEKLSVINNLT